MPTSQSVMTLFSASDVNGCEHRFPWAAFPADYYDRFHGGYLSFQCLRGLIVMRDAAWLQNHASHNLQIRQIGVFLISSGIGSENHRGHGEKSNALRPPRPLWLIFFESTQKKLKSVKSLPNCIPKCQSFDLTLNNLTYLINNNFK